MYFFYTFIYLYIYISKLFWVILHLFIIFPKSNFFFQTFTFQIHLNFEFSVDITTNVII